MIIDWAPIERAWSEAVLDAIVATSNSNPTECFYAGAFWLLYGDYLSLHAPVFGLNSENSDPEVRWHPPDWRWSIIDEAHERVAYLYRPFLELQVDTSTYEAIWQQHIDMLARTARRVTDVVRSHELPVNGSAFTPKFFVGIIDFAHGDDAIEYLRRSVDKETIVASGILAADH